MKRIIAVLLTAIMIFGLIGCAKQAAPEPKPTTPKVVFIAADGGLEGNRSNTAAYEGIKKAEEDYKIEVSTVEPATSTEYVDAISKAAADGAKMVIGTGYISVETMTKIAAKYPDTYFALLDYANKVADNVMSLVYKEQEGAFIAGVIAGLTTKTQVVGFVGGEDTPAVDTYEYGFRAGVKAISPNYQVVVGFTGSFEDPQTGKTIAQSLISQGADVLYHEAGTSGDGVIAAAKDAGIWAIGSDGDQSEQAPKTVLCSTYERLDNGVYLAIQTMMEDDFKGGIFEFGLDFEAVGYTDEAGNLPPVTEEQAKAYIKAILAGDIYVPANRSDFEAFTVPVGGFLTKQ